MEITEDNISQLVNQTGGGKPCYILIYANWCGHCTKFKPTWEKLNKEMPEVFLAQIESSVIDNIQNKPEFIKNIIGFPTIREIRKNGVEEYKGDPEEVKKWIKRKKGGSRKSKKSKSKKAKRPKSKQFWGL
jgi:thiol-disulfide isomerase/thioredoxin